MTQEPTLATKTGVASPAALLTVDGVVQHFPIRKGILQRQVGVVHAVNGVSFTIMRGQTLSLVGESGSGKTTVARAVVRFEAPTSGTVIFDGVDMGELRPRALRAIRSRIQYVFQDPHQSLSPRMTVSEIIEEPLRIHRIGDAHARRSRALELLELVGLSSQFASRYAHQFSGGQRQRIGIARALALNPELLVLDEPLSALDVSVQAQIVSLLERLQSELGIAYLLVAHDLEVVHQMSDFVAVMYLGSIVEYGDADAVFAKPSHPYTRALLDSSPLADPRAARLRVRTPLVGELPSPVDPPSGCAFRTRCPFAQAICASEKPQLQPSRVSGAMVACHFADSLPTAALDLRLQS